MRSLIEKMYRSLQDDLQSEKRKGLPMSREIECCFQICVQYWEKIRQVIIYYTFESEPDEIDFFKHLKPLFTSEIEYYNFLYHAALFLPEGGPEKEQKFWKLELERLQKMCDECAAFFLYLESGGTGEDVHYFKKMVRILDSRTGDNVYDQDRRASCAYDYHLALYGAIKKYRNYVQCRVK